MERELSPFFTTTQGREELIKLNREILAQRHPQQFVDTVESSLDDNEEANDDRYSA